MRVTKIIILGVALVTLSSCATTKNASNGNAPVSEEVNVVEVIDWDGRSLGESAAPAWLKNIFRGNADYFKEEFGVSEGRICKLSRANAKTLATAQALSRSGFSYSLAAELNQKIIGRIGQGLNDVGQLEALYLAASQTKADVVGLREESTFWQKVRLTEKGEKHVTESYIFYTVYSMNEESWEKLTKKYLLDLMGDTQLETETQKKIGSLFTEMKADADKVEAKKQAEEERLYREQMARIQTVSDRMKEERKSEQVAVDEANEILESYLQ